MDHVELENNDTSFSLPFVDDFEHEKVQILYMAEDLRSNGDTSLRDDASISASLGGTSSVASVGTTTSSTVSIQVSALQASFAEKTAKDMKEILDWYNKHKEEDRFVKVSQSQSLPHNPLTCIDDEDALCDTLPPLDVQARTPLKMDNDLITPQHSNVKRPRATNRNSSEHTFEFDLLEEDFVDRSQEHSTVLYEESESQLVERMAHTSSPTSVAELSDIQLETPQKTRRQMSRAPTPGSAISSITNTTVEAELQQEEVNQLLEATESMAALVTRMQTPPRKRRANVRTPLSTPSLRRRRNRLPPTLTPSAPTRSSTCTSSLPEHQPVRRWLFQNPNKRQQQQPRYRQLHANRMKTSKVMSNRKTTVVLQVAIGVLSILLAIWMAYQLHAATVVDD